MLCHDDNRDDQATNWSFTQCTTHPTFQNKKASIHVRVLTLFSAHIIQLISSQRWYRISVLSSHYTNCIQEPDYHVTVQFSWNIKCKNRVIFKSLWNLLCCQSFQQIHKLQAKLHKCGYIMGLYKNWHGTFPFTHAVHKRAKYDKMKTMTHLSTDTGYNTNVIYCSLQKHKFTRDIFLIVFHMK